METIDYQKQAADFLKETDTQFETEFLKHGKHFDDDKDTRDIYKVMLRRGKREYSFNFGQSISKGKRFKDKTTGLEFYANGDNVQPFGKPQKVTSQYLKEFCRFVIPGEAPTAYDVLAALTKYNPDTLENFCAEFGYDTDSKKAEKIYHAVMDEWQNLKALFNDKELEKLAEIN